MNNNLLKARKKYANSAIFAVLTLIIGYTFLSTGNITAFLPGDFVKCCCYCYSC